MSGNDSESQEKVDDATSGARARDGYLRIDPKRFHLARLVLGEVSDGRKVWGGCDDFSPPDGWTAEEAAALSADMHGWNGYPQDCGDDPWCFSFLFDYLSAALLAHAERTGARLPPESTEPEPLILASLADRAWYAWHCLPRGHRNKPPSRRSLEQQYGLAGATLAKVFSGERKAVEGDTLLKMAKALGVRPEWLLKGSGAPPKLTGPIRERSEEFGGSHG